MKTKLCSLAITVLAAASAFAGDIFEIRPCTGTGGPAAAYATKADPIVSVPAEPYYFTVRLQIRHDTAFDGPNVNSTGLRKYFRIAHTNPLASEEYDASIEANRLGIGIYVSGKEGAGDVIGSAKIEYAKLVDIIPNGNSVSNFFDCVFEYKPKSGHFALPIRLAVIDKDGMTGVETIRPADDSKSTTTYLFCNTDKWEIRYMDLDNPAKNDKPVDWTIATSSPEFYDNMGTMPNGSSYTSYMALRESDFTGASVGLFVKTVDFDQEEGWEDPSYWHEVPMGEDLPFSIKAIADATGVAEDTTLYVWSDDESAIKIVGDGVKTVEMVTNVVGLTKYTAEYQVGEVKILGGRVSANFRVFGVESNKIANVVLSSWMGFRYQSALNTMAEDYLKIPVKCGDLAPASVELSFNDKNPKASASKSLTVQASTNFVDRSLDAVPFYITLTQPHTTEVKVGIKVGFNDTAPTQDPLADKYIVLSENGDEFFVNDCCTNVTFAAGETQKKIYIYPLGSDAASKGGIQFTPVILSTGADPITYEAGKDALLKIEQDKPIILSPADPYQAGTVSGVPNEGFGIELVVNDCYRDMMNTNGFRVVFGDGFRTQPETNIVFTAGEPLELIITGYKTDKEGEQNGTIKIYEHGSNTKYSLLNVKFNVAVEKPKFSYVDLYTSTSDDSKSRETQFEEGSALIPRFYVSEPMSAGEKIFFFLRPLNEASSKYVSCLAFTQGIELTGGATNTQVLAAYALNFLDGCPETEVLEYEIVARTAKMITDGAESMYYTPGQKLILSVKNVNPEVQEVKVNGASEAVENNRDAVWIHPVSAQVDVPFMAKLGDPSKYFDISNGLMTVWCFTDGRTSNQYKYEFAKITNRAETVTVKHEFGYAGGSTQDVSVVALDKDMLKAITGSETYFDEPTQAQLGELWTAVSDKAKSYYGVPYRFKVAVGKRPTVSISFPANENKDEITINENETTAGKKGKMRIELTEPAQDDLTIKVVVTSLNEEPDLDDGTLELDSYTFTIKQNEVEPKKSTVYNDGALFKYRTLDGTAASASAGFYIKVTVDDADWADYFDYGEGWVYVENTPPVITPPESDVVVTNTVVIGQEIAVQWRADDVKADITAGLEAHWYDNDVEIPNTSQVITSNGWNTTTFRLTTDGIHRVRLEVLDKEGADYRGKAERNWYYWISPVKTLELRPYRPVATTKSRYGTAAGRGQGRVFANSGSPVVQDFVQTWTYGVQNNFADIYAYGYPSKSDDAGNPVAYYDDGTMARDVALTADGNSWPTGSTVEPTQCYKIDGIYDNYFYRWVCVGYPQTGGISTNEYQVVEATIKPAQVVSTQVGLDPYEENKTSYARRTVEAIFSREKYTADNCGDIDGDGIPDLYVSAYRFNVYDASNNMVGSDIDPLDTYNEDGDYLPLSVVDTFEAFVPGLTNNWVVEFQALDEIRGFGKHFNDANLIPENIVASGIGITSDIRFTDPATDKKSTLEPVEWAAYQEYCEKQGWDPADESHWGIQKDANGILSYDNSWSPERPTSPVKADTDGDGIPDGFEYYVWYRAHVGELDFNGNLKKLTGRRYVVTRPCEPDFIDSDTIADAYDPLVKNPNFATMDTDNDGLPDFIEYVLGTNPFNYDSDYDGLPDGYEVYVTQTDPLVMATNKIDADGDLNPDGDAFAIRAAEDAVAVAWLDEDGATNYYVVAKKEGIVLDGTTISAVEDTPFIGWRYWGIGGTPEEPLPRFAMGRELTKDSIIGKEVVGEVFKVELLYLHFQVYQKFGFDPRTGWNIPPFYVGHLTDSMPFTHMDEFLVLAFYMNAGGDSPSTKSYEWGDHWKAYQKNSRNIGVVPGSMPDDVLFQLWTLAATNPLECDTDRDGMPDGWELYTQAGKREPEVVAELAEDFDKVSMLFGPGSPWSPLSDFGLIAGTNYGDPEDGHGDGLDFPHEYSGYESVALYTNKCDTIKLLQPEWKNKIWPTDPWNGDTDGDGLLDGKEGELFVYGDNVHKRSDLWDCVSGGGLDPLSWDTDCDGLPDPWEAEFPGKYVTVEDGKVTVQEQPPAEDPEEEEETDEDSEEGGDEGDPNGDYGDLDDGEENEDGIILDKNVALKNGWQGGMDGTTSDSVLDYDCDGLQNWQEYMVAAMRCWRYDDTISTWGVHKSAEVDFASFTDDDWYDFIVNPASENFCHTFGNERFDPGVYFCCATNLWERNQAKKKMYMFKDGYYHDLKKDAKKTKYNRWTKGKAGVGYDVKGTYPTTYVSTDPRSQDTDGDGMDDYYELFHGMNPILGTSGLKGKVGKASRDIVYESWAGSLTHGHPWKATLNYWYGDAASVGYTRDDYLPLHLKDDTGYDFFQFPWLSGLASADFDGDNLRNQQECLLANVQAANSYLHTDPSPLWATDINFADSYVRRWYFAIDPDYAITKLKIAVPKSFTHDGVKYTFKQFPWLKYDAHEGIIAPDPAAINLWETIGPMFSVEQNEGYDSDHDYISDFEEAQGKTKSCSDPQVSDDPLRRQAMWFGGKSDPGFLQTPIPQDEVDATGHSGDLRRDFLYYTVECWAKADEESLGSGLHTLVERATVSGTAGPADEMYLRKNFLLGVRNGRWYTKFDSTGVDLEQCVDIVDGPLATTNWTHVAATYDGSMLKLYVNGVCRSAIDTMLMPEHGLSSITVTKFSEMDKKQIFWKVEELYPRWMNSIIIGASASTVYGVCFDLQWLTRSQEYYPEAPHVNESYITTINDYDSFFKGYIDEVRIWDGARKEAEISDDYKARTRYTPALTLEKRKEVLEAWLDGGSLAPTSGSSEIPADIRFHWSFDHVSGAVKPQDVMTAPAGFQTDGNVTDAMAYWARPDGWTSPWLDNIDESIQSKVFTDHSWVPWIANTVGALPRLDGSTLDSVYWNEDYAGMTSAQAAGYPTFAFKRNAEVYSYWIQGTWEKNHHGIYSHTATDDLMTMFGKKKQRTFNLRGKITVGNDLLPFGSAFPKRISADEGGMWDDQGAADAWAQTGDDGTHNGLPDWWEEYARQNYADLEPGDSFGWDSSVDYFGQTMQAWEAYKRDLAKGLLPDGVYHDGKNTADDYRDTRDNDHDGILDWWEDIYRIDTGSYTDAHADPDNDGLSNYVEYMLTEVFDLKDSDGNTLIFNPKEACSINPEVSDYFYRLGDLYVGEVFTDHDRIDDDWELKYFPTVSPYLYDAGDDPDGDGWSNYAEFQAGTDPTSIGSIGIDEVQIDEYPIPTVEVYVNYEGNQNTIDKPLVIKSWSDPTLESVPDAVWTVGKIKDQKAAANGNVENVTGTKYIGMNPNKELMFHLSPGSVVKNTVKFEYKDINWYLLDLATGMSWVSDGITAIWVECLYDQEIPGFSNKGNIIDKFTKKVVGSIDYATGAVTLDLTAVSDYMAVEGDISGGMAIEGGHLVSVYDLDQSYIRVNWSSKPITGGKSATYYLSDADEPSAELNSNGHVKEGRNTFIAFYDLDGDGKYTAGEPYGTTRDVDVGWNYAKVAIELTDTSAVSPRFNTQDATNDREVLYGTSSGNVDPSWIISKGSPSGGKYERVRVIRTLIDDQDVLSRNVPDRLVLDKMIYTDDEQLYITEADFLKDGSYDLDWEYLADDIASGNTEGMPIRNVAYRIVLGSGTIKNSQTNNLLELVFRRQFDLAEVYTDASQKPVCIGPGLVNAASPTFSWYVPNGLNSYTAFQIRVYDGNTVIWESGYQLMPPRVRDNTYGWRWDWTAPIYAGDKLLNGKVFKNNANYKWDVRVTNARFRNIENWSVAGQFRMNVLTNSMDYGTVNVAVRHFGPSQIRTSGTIRVQAFETPDFSGTPVSQGYVTKLSDVGSEDKIDGGNAALLGVPAGRYYIRAFVDSNNDGICQDWETQGYTCARDHDAGQIFTPRSIEVGPAIGLYNTVPVYLEDSDTDNDNLPDAWEYAVNGSLEKMGVTALDENLANGVAMKRSLLGTLTTKGDPIGGLSVLTRSALSNPYVAALVCGVTVTGGESVEEVTAALAASAGGLNGDSTVEITSVSLDPVKHCVHVEMAGTLVNSVNAMSFYSFDGIAGSNYKFKLLHKDTLMDAEWQKVSEVQFSLGLNEKSLDIPVNEDIDFNSGFFMLAPETK